MVDHFLEAHEKPPRQIILDLDATDDPIHGHQEGRFFHGYYGHYCYLPLYIFCGEFLLCAQLRSADIDASAGTVEELKRIVAQIRQEVAAGADSGAGRFRILPGSDHGLVRTPRRRLRVWTGEERRVDPRNRKGTGESREEISKDGQGRPFVQGFPVQHQRNLEPQTSRHRQSRAFDTRSQSSFRRDVAAVAADGSALLYERTYCARGEMENRIKEQQLGLFADRTSTATMRGNQLRLYFSSVAYILMQTLRRLGLKGTDLARAQCTTIRLKLLKIGAQIHVTVRRVWFRMAAGYPYADVFAQVYTTFRSL